MHEPLPQHGCAQTVPSRKLHRDFELRSKADLTKVGAARYATDPSTEVLWVAFAVDNGPVQLWRPGDPVPPEYFEAAVNPNWTAVAHNDPFESAIEEHKLHPLYGFPIIPPERHRCTQAAALALGLPAKLGLLADVLELINRKDAAGERLMHLMSKPRKPRFGEDPKGTYWHEDEPQMQRLGSYCMVDVEVEREADGRLPQLSDAEQAVWVLSNAVNARGFHVDRVFAEAARKITKAAGPEINDKIKAITAGAVTTIHQVDKLKKWLQLHGCPVTSLDHKVIEKLFEDADGLAVPVRQALTLRLDGAQATTKKLDALLAGAGDDDRIRGALRYCGTSTGRWTGERFQPQNLKRITIEDLDSAIAAVATGDYAHVKALYPQPLSVVGECIRPTIDAAPDHELIGGDFGAVESRVLAWIAGEKWKIDAYHKYDTTKAPSDEPYIQTAAKVLRVNSPVTITKAQRKIGKTCDLAFGYMGGLGAWRNFEPDQYSDAEVEKFKNEWRAAHPKIRQFWNEIDQAAVRAVRDRGEIVRCGPVTLNFSGAFLWIRLPSGRDLAYPYPRIIKDLAAAQARNVDGIAFVLTPADPFIVTSLDDCRHPRTRSIDVWAQNFLDVTCESYAEVTPSGDGIRIWGLTTEGTADIDWKFALSIDGKEIAVELFRLTARILPVTGFRLDAVEELANIDHGIDWALAWGDRREAQAAEAALPTKPASAPEPKPKPAADVSEKPAPKPAPEPAPAAPASPEPAAATAASRNGVHHAARARSSILFDLSEVTTIDLADLINDPGMRNRKICCPFHDEKTPSLHIYPDHYYCFGCGAYGDHIDWLIQIEGLDHTAAQERLTNWTDPVISQRTATGGPTLEDIEQAEKDRAYVLRWWDAAKLIRGTLAARYLADTRGIDLDHLPDNVDDVLRFHPKCVFGPGVTQPCLIALMRDARGDAPIGIQRIALTPDAQKIDRRMLGLSGVVKLWPAGGPSLVIGEGLETVLAAATRLDYRDEPLRPAWAALGALKKFPLIDGVERLIVLADNDANNAGQTAAEACKRRWLEAGRRVALLMPDRPGTDFNDIVLSNLEHAS